MIILFRFLFNCFDLFNSSTKITLLSFFFFSKFCIIQLYVTQHILPLCSLWFKNFGAKMTISNAQQINDVESKLFRSFYLENNKYFTAIEKYY
jgi:hypothetical protein